MHTRHPLSSYSTIMNEYVVAYEQRMWIPEGGYITSRNFQHIFARDMTHAQGKWSAMRLDNQDTLFINKVD